MTDRAYVDRRVVDLDGADAAARAAAQDWDLAEPEVMRLGMNAIYRSGDAVLRVATPNADASLSIELASMLGDRGIPVVKPLRPALTVEGFAVTAWDHVESTGEPIDWRRVGEIVARVQAIPADDLPVALPRPSPTDFPWWDHESLLEDVGDEIGDDAVDGIRRAIERHDGWDDFVGSAANVVCHGDVHPGNVIMSSYGPVLIDWDLLCIAPAGWDHAPMMTWTERWGGEPGVYEALAEGAGWSGRGDRHAEAFAELRLVAATLMRWRVSRSLQDARPEAERRLAYWRGEADAPAWSAQ